MIFSLKKVYLLIKLYICVKKKLHLPIFLMCQYTEVFEVFILTLEFIIYEEKNELGRITTGTTKN